MSVHRDFSRESWSPEGQASWDQLHAQALDKLRGTGTFVLAYLTMHDDDPEPRVEAAVIGANCETDLHARILFSVLDRAVDEMRDAYTGTDG